MPKIIWQHSVVRGDKPSSDFLEVVRDCFLQHFTKYTRGRTGQNPSTIDLLFIDDDFITELRYDNPLGKSDHCILLFVI